MQTDNLFIENIMNKILEPLTYDYSQQKERAEQMSARELYETIVHNINIMASSNDSETSGTTIFATPGCPHKVRDGHYCGCSFCDWSDSNVADVALIATLRRKDPNLYKKMQAKSFEVLRGKNVNAKNFEEYAIHDCFDDREISEEERRYLFEECPIFSKKPIIGLIQVRADSVTLQKIENWKHTVRKQLTVGVGIETGNNWLRNHWLNKGLNDIAIKNAVKITHEAKCKISSNLLMIIPGLNDKQNVQVMIESIRKMHEYEFDFVMLSPLVNKKYTIQNYLNENNFSIEKRQHNLFILYKMLTELSKLESVILKKLMFSSFNFMEYFDQFDENCNLLCKEIFRSLLSFGAMKDLSKTIEQIKNVFEERKLAEEEEKYNLLGGIEDLKKNIKQSGEVLVTTLFDESDWEYQLSVLNMELADWDDLYANVSL